MPQIIDTRQRVQVTVLTESERRGWVNPELHFVLTQNYLNPKNHRDFIFDEVPIHAVHPVDAARNQAVSIMLARNADWLVLIDNDIAPPINLFDVIRKFDDRHDIIVFPYYVWTPELYPMVCFGRAGDGEMVVPHPGELKQGWNEIGAGGTGCIFIHRRVFTGGRLDEPFFRIPLDAKKGQLMSEDIEFTLRAKKAGYRLWTHTDNVCAHFRTMDTGLAALGMNTILKKYSDAVQKKYGDIGISVPDLNTMLYLEAMEKREAAEAEAVAHE